MSEQILASYGCWLSIVTLHYYSYNLGKAAGNGDNFRDSVWYVVEYLELHRLLIITFCILNLIYL